MDKDQKRKAAARGEELDRKRMLDPDAWPRWPLLPVKRESKASPVFAHTTFGILELGVMFSGDVTSGVFKVYAQTLYAKMPLLPPFAQYDTIDALLADGWRVD